MSGEPSFRRVLVWDAPTRLFHWFVVLGVIAAYVTERLDWMDWHSWIGDAVLAFVLFRLLWGVFGSETNRVAALRAGPRAALHHLAHVFRREPDRQVGHNPAGGWMVLLLLALLLGETLTGIYTNNDVANEAGPLAPYVPASVANLLTDLHLYFWYALLAAVALHVAAIAVYAAAKGHDLLTPMITGRKTLPVDVAAPRVVGVARAAIFLGCGALAAAALATYL